MNKRPHCLSKAMWSFQTVDKVRPKCIAVHNSQPVRPLRFPWAQLQPPRHCVPVGSSAFAVPQESSWPARLGCVALIQERSLLVNFRKCNPCKSVNPSLKDPERKAATPAGTAKCRNPLGRQSELVRREPAESVRLKRRIRYKQDKMCIHSLNDINILLSTSSDRKAI